MQDKLAEASLGSNEALDDRPPDFPKETSVEMRCFDAFSAVSHFEKTHCLALQVRGCTSSCLIVEAPASGTLLAIRPSVLLNIISAGLVAGRSLPRE